jgi:hypothetical protein
MICPNCAGKLLPVANCANTLGCLRCRETWPADTPLPTLAGVRDVEQPTPLVAEPPPFALTAPISTAADAHQPTLLAIETVSPRCDMDRTCADSITHIDEKGWLYCTKHGQQRSTSGIRCRKMTAAELQRILCGKTLKSY